VAACELIFFVRGAVSGEAISILNEMLPEPIDLVESSGVLDAGKCRRGVIDPTKVTRTALQNAASIAGLLLTTEAMVVDFPEQKATAPAAWTAAIELLRQPRGIQPLLDSQNRKGLQLRLNAFPR
jgi:hypothetical protein